MRTKVFLADGPLSAELDTETGEVVLRDDHGFVRKLTVEEAFHLAQFLEPLTNGVVQLPQVEDTTAATR